MHSSFILSLALISHLILFSFFIGTAQAKDPEVLYQLRRELGEELNKRRSRNVPPGESDNSKSDGGQRSSPDEEAFRSPG